MAKVMDDRRYAESHEWVKIDGDIATIGISDYAQHALGDIVYVDMPEVGDEMSAGDVFGAVESVKAASDLICPVSGEVVEINEELEDAPEKVNADAFERAKDALMECGYNAHVYGAPVADLCDRVIGLAENGLDPDDRALLEPLSRLVAQRVTLADLAERESKEA